MFTIKHQHTTPLKAVPVSEFILDQFITLEDENVLKGINDFSPRKSNQEVFVSKSYSVLKDLNLIGLTSKFDMIVNYYSKEILKCPLQFKMVGSWLTKNVKGTLHSPHRHRNSYISVVSYFGDFEEYNSAGIQFVDLGLSDVFEEKNINFYGENDSKFSEWNIFNNKTYTIKSKKNQVIVFPGHIQHQSEVCQSENRFCVGVNYFITGTLGTIANKNLITF